MIADFLDMEVVDDCWWLASGKRWTQIWFVLLGVWSETQKIGWNESKKTLKNISSGCWFCKNHSHKMFISCNSFGVTATPGLLTHKQYLQIDTQGADKKLPIHINIVHCWHPTIYDCSKFFTHWISIRLPLTIRTNTKYSRFHYKTRISDTSKVGQMPSVFASHVGLTQVPKPPKKTPLTWFVDSHWQWCCCCQFLCSEMFRCMTTSPKEYEGNGQIGKSTPHQVTQIQVHVVFDFQTNRDKT